MNNLICEAMLNDHDQCNRTGKWKLGHLGSISFKHWFCKTCAREMLKSDPGYFIDEKNNDKQSAKDSINNLFWRSVFMNEVLYPDVSVKLVGEDGNAFAIMGRVSRAMRLAKISSTIIKEFTNEAMSGDYDNVLQTCMKYVKVL